jgi:hypothetical protein
VGWAVYDGAAGKARYLRENLWVLMCNLVVLGGVANMLGAT